jgi:hypothetical protein
MNADLDRQAALVSSGVLMLRACSSRTEMGLSGVTVPTLTALEDPR